MANRCPIGLAAGGKALWIAVNEIDESLDAAQLVQLEEACRAKDRLDKLDALLRGKVDTWARLTHRVQNEDYELKIDAALSQANATANLMKQLLAALRLPDESTGRKPQKRGANRGVYASGGKVSSLDRARAKKMG